MPGDTQIETGVTRIVKIRREEPSTQGINQKHLSTTTQVLFI